MPRPKQTSKKSKGEMPSKKKAEKEEGADGVKKPKKRAKRTESFHRYILFVLKQINPEFSMSTKTASVMNSFAEAMLKDIARCAGEMASSNNVKTMTEREIFAAIKMNLPKEIAKHTVKEASVALSKYTSH